MIARTPPPKNVSDDDKKALEAVKLEKQRQITQFRNLFVTPDGQDVWAFLHLQLGTFESSTDPTPAEAALKAFGMKLFEYAGANYEVNAHEMANVFWKVRPVFETEKLLESEEKKA